MGSQPLTATEAVAAVARGTTSVTDVAAACLDRVRELDPGIGAFRVIDESLVTDRAKDLDHRLAGRLHGLVVGVKDVIDTAALPTGYGSPLFADHQPQRDAAVVAALLQAGALVLGKTESTEFALFNPTRTRNPIDPSRTPGGSSSGSAAAVAAGMVPVALGTQTAGSVLRPAAFCGVYGYKPARGWISTAGVWQLSESLDTIGLFARTAADLALVYAALHPPAQPHHRFVRTDPRVVVLRAAEWAATDSDVDDALDFVIEGLRAAGWQVSDAAMPEAWRRLPEQHDTAMAVEVARNLTTALGPRLGEISESAREIVERGDRCTARAYLAALQARDEAVEAADALSVAADLVLLPTALGVAPQGLESTGDPVMCRPATLLGLPAANVPAYRRADSLPVGVQAVGLHDDDPQFLADLMSLETALSGKEH